MQYVSSRQVPWMKYMAKQVDDVMTAEQAAMAGGLDFTVSLRDVQYATPTTGGHTLWSGAPSRKAVVRDDTDDLFEIVSSTYAPLQYGDAFAFLDEISPKFVAAGAIKGGRQGFMVIQAPEEIGISLALDDPHELYVIVRTSHDRSRGIEVAVMPLRLKCMNSVAMASFTNGAPQRWAITHVGDVAGKMHNAAQLIAGTSAYAKRYAEQVERLAKVQLHEDDARLVLKRVIRESPKQSEAVQQIVDIWHTAETVALGDSGWGLVNAVSDYFEWNRKGGSDQSQILGVLEGVTTKAISRTAALVLSRS